MKILGVEGTAWNASASVFDPSEGVLSLVSNPYVPDSGGIHPREASEHMSNHIVDVIDEAVDEGVDSTDEIDAVAFSRGPGLGPCLRTVATASRATALSLNVPLVGVNHTVAHIEIGRYFSGFDDPVVLDAAGANTVITTYRGGRYRVVGETLDTGVGNSLDKFARHADLSHPGGPKLEKLAKDADEYVELPYTVKGMDFSFSGIINAAQSKYDDGTSLEDLAYSLQENIFGMLTEVSERALALTRKDEFVVGGGVSRNERLREMLEAMCEDRGASFYAPEPQYLSDNAAMIAVAGWMMFREDQTIDVEESAVDPDWRPDQLDVSWRDEPESYVEEGAVHGAEAVVEFDSDTVTKTRVAKTYRESELDNKIRKKRNALEARLTSEARRAGVPTPTVLDVDSSDYTLTIERLSGPDLADEGSLDRNDASEIGNALSNLHDAGIAHGDPTTRNMVRDGDCIYFIDFGLSYNTRDIEDFGMDIHVLRQTLEGTVENPRSVMQGFWEGYDWEKAEKVKKRLEEIEGRGRYL